MQHSDNQQDTRFTQLYQDQGVFASYRRESKESVKLNSKSFFALYSSGWLSSERYDGIHAVRTQFREMIPVDTVLSRSVRRMILRSDFRFSTNQCFNRVLQNCATPRDWSPGNVWIGTRTQALLSDLHRRGLAHSLEVYKDNELVGGLIGLQIGGMFVGMSVYSDFNGAGNAALGILNVILFRQGFAWIDALGPSHISRSFGGQLMREKECARIRAQTTGLETIFPDYPEPLSAEQMIAGKRIFAPTPQPAPATGIATRLRKILTLHR